MTRAPEPALEMKSIVKRFGDLTAVDGVDLECRVGEVHALAGENGAGKSTLMGVLYGRYRPNEGSMRLFGEAYSPQHPREALSCGVGMVHQHFMLIPTLTVAENAILGDERGTLGFLDRRSATSRVVETSERFGLDLRPDALVEDLSVGERQRLEILKVLMRGARLLVLDEPTAVLVPTETRKLFETVRALTDEGASVVFITHKLHEVLEHAQRVTVMRRGRYLGTFDTEGLTERDLARTMVGRDPAPPRSDFEASSSSSVLSVRELSERVTGSRKKRLDGVSFDVHAGEIVGVAGVAGNGQRELVEMLAGLLEFDGEAHVGGVSLRGKSPGDIRAQRVAHIPEDRTLAGVIAEFTIAENLLLGRETERRFLRGLSFDLKKIAEHARERVEAFDVRPPEPQHPVGGLSGGNQQKVVIAREAEQEPRLLLAAHPTRGVDVGAQEAIHDALIALRTSGSAILLVSADLAELHRLSDRILVLAEGRIAREFARGEADDESLGLAMLGRAPASSAEREG